MKTPPRSPQEQKQVPHYRSHPSALSKSSKRQKDSSVRALEPIST